MLLYSAPKQCSGWASRATQLIMVPLSHTNSDTREGHSCKARAWAPIPLPPGPGSPFHRPSLTHKRWASVAQPPPEARRRRISSHGGAGSDLCERAREGGTSLKAETVPAGRHLGKDRYLGQEPRKAPGCSAALPGGGGGGETWRLRTGRCLAVLPRPAAVPGRVGARPGASSFANQGRTAHPGFAERIRRDNGRQGLRTERSTK